MPTLCQAGLWHDQAGEGLGVLLHVWAGPAWACVLGAATKNSTAVSVA